MADSYTPFEGYPDVLNVEQMQSALGIGRSTAYKLIKNKEIRTLKIGRTIKIPKRYLMDFLDGRCYNEPIAASKLAAVKEV